MTLRIVRIFSSLDKIFRLEEIDGDGQCPIPYMKRWTLLRLKWKSKTFFTLYLHRMIDQDWSKDFHDHPKRFISIGLRGSYLEETPNGNKTYRAPWIRTFPASHIHRLRIIGNKPCWTICLTFKTVQGWGFWIYTEEFRYFFPWKKYVEDRKFAATRKSCK